MGYGQSRSEKSWTVPSLHHSMGTLGSGLLPIDGVFGKSWPALLLCNHWRLVAVWNPGRGNVVSSVMSPQVGGLFFQNSSHAELTSNCFSEL